MTPSLIRKTKYSTLQTPDDPWREIYKQEDVVPVPAGRRPPPSVLALGGGGGGGAGEQLCRAASSRSHPLLGPQTQLLEEVRRLHHQVALIV